MSDIKYRFRDIRSGTIFFFNGEVYVKTCLIEHHPADFTEYSNAVNKHGRHVEIDDFAEVKGVGHLDEYHEPKASNASKLAVPF